jgi:hypothetical protein
MGTPRCSPHIGFQRYEEPFFDYVRLSEPTSGLLHKDPRDGPQCPTGWTRRARQSDPVCSYAYDALQLQDDGVLDEVKTFQVPDEEVLDRVGNRRMPVKTLMKTRPYQTIVVFQQRQRQRTQEGGRKWFHKEGGRHRSASIRPHLQTYRPGRLGAICARTFPMYFFSSRASRAFR